MRGIMLGCRRLTQHLRNATRRARPVCPDRPPCRRPAALPASPPAVPAAVPAGFTLIEMLIVIGLLGAVAMVLLTSFNIDREKTLDDSIVQKELADIQHAFHRMAADCVLQQDDYRLISRYGLAILIKHGGYLVTPDRWSFPGDWDADRGKGWRGPYVQQEGRRDINISANGDDIGVTAQGPGADTTIPVICTPYAADDEYAADGHYYRVIPELDPNDTSRIIQLWAIDPKCPFTVVVSSDTDYAEFVEYPRKRRLLLED